MSNIQIFPEQGLKKFESRENAASGTESLVST